MVWRIHFTVQDLARTRLAETPMPMAELGDAVRVLQERQVQPLRLDAWRRDALTRLPGQARRVLSLIPAIGWSPSFLTPQLGGTPEELMEHIRATSGKQIVADLADIAEAGQRLPVWARRLADDPALRQELFDGVEYLVTRLLGTSWPRLVEHYASDRAVRVRQLTGGGIERLLSQANPRWMRWKPPVLEMRTVRKDVEFDVRLEGRGLLLVPSGFHVRPTFQTDAEPRPTLTYPVGLDQPLERLTVLAPTPRAATTTAAVAALLGHTRAAVLNSIADRPGCTTTELAALAGISPASASEHATVLRKAGLTRTVRYRNTVLHSPTRLGDALLDTPPSH